MRSPDSISEQSALRDGCGDLLEYSGWNVMDVMACGNAARSTPRYELVLRNALDPEPKKMFGQLGEGRSERL